MGISSVGANSKTPARTPAEAKLRSLEAERPVLEAALKKDPSNKNRQTALLQCEVSILGMKRDAMDVKAPGYGEVKKAFQEKSAALEELLGAAIDQADAPKSGWVK